MKEFITIAVFAVMTFALAGVCERLHALTLQIESLQSQPRHITAEIVVINPGETWDVKEAGQ